MKTKRELTRAEADLAFQALVAQRNYVDGWTDDQVEELVRLMDKLRSERPFWACPFCKSQLDVPCMSCKGVRYWTESQARGIDIDQRYLLEGDDAHVCIRGNPVPLARLRATQAPEIRDVGNGR